MRIRDLLGILLLASCWGTTFLFIKVLVGYLPPLTMTMLRCGMAGLTLSVLCVIFRVDFRPLRQHWRDLLVVAFFGSALPMGLCASGELMVDSSTASIIEATVPIFVLLLTYLSSHDARLGKWQYLSVVLGFLGILVIFGSDLGSLFAIDSRASNWGKLQIVMMACSFAVCFVYSKMHLTHLPPLFVICCQLVLSTMILIPSSLVFEGSWKLAGLPYEFYFSLAGLALWGTVCGWLVYSWLIQRICATQVALANYLGPVIAISLGTLLLGETLNSSQILGSIIILAAMALASMPVETDETLISVEQEAA
ncbi:MAG: hypothetical protein CMO81_08345 [Waddliaceae bacterium]|nr:hypothetical protein [Waddliaceae bacterium]